MAGEFDSAWLKWGWAQREATMLQQDFLDWTAHPEYERMNTVRCDYQRIDTDSPSVSST